MAHLSGAFLIDCPASALNNFGSQVDMVKAERRYDNWSTVKYVRTREGIVPYVSAQAFRYWWRDVLKTIPGWTATPIFREEKIAYTDANPIDYAEDDLFGYMRAPAESQETEKAWAEQKLTGQEKDGKKKFVTLTRSSPLKTSTLVSICPLREIGFDYGTMSRGEGNPVPHVHEFYRTTLVGLFSIDLRMAGRFYHVSRTGFKHLDDVRKKLADERKLAAYDGDKAYELDLDTRKRRLIQLLEGLACITGGAKQALHYTDVAPKLLFLGVARGGNHLFGTSLGANKQEGTPKINDHALAEVASVFEKDLLSGFYCGLSKGYLDDQRDALQAVVGRIPGSSLGHPVEAIRKLIADLDEKASAWLA
jgi:CRISPR-associated protein Cst2